VGVLEEFVIPNETVRLFAIAITAPTTAQRPYVTKALIVIITVIVVAQQL
jgi:hypothetical protein